MLNRLSLWPACALLVIAGGTTRAHTAPTSSIMAIIARLERDPPITVAALRSAIDVEAVCRQFGSGDTTFTGCDASIKLANGETTGVKFQLFKRAATVTLFIPHTSCPTVAELIEKYSGGGMMDGGCTDGVRCTVYAVSRPWGSIKIGPGTSQPGACAQTVNFHRWIEL